jgi:uncharacterized protein
MSVAPELLEILVCPKCKGDLEYRPDPEALICNACRLVYAVEDGIPIMLIDEAESVDDAEHDRLTAKAEADGIRPTGETEGS